ncbi:hypothetical protein [Sphingomonas hankookensis]
MPAVRGWEGCHERSILNEGIQSATILFDSLEATIPPPKWQNAGNHFNWTYVERSPAQAMLLKLAGQLSGANALDLLIGHGFIQEAGALQRSLDEINEDILFIALAVATGNWTDYHDAYLDYFWSDTQGQPPVQRKRIRAYVNRVFAEQLDPSGADAVGRELYSAFSDFVHARSGPIIGLLIGPPPRFDLNGVQHPEQIQAFVDQAPTYGFRCLASATAVAQALSSTELGLVAHKAFKLFERQHAGFLLKE